MKPKVILSLGFDTKHDVTIFDVGQGECALISSERLLGAIVDCGAASPQSHCNVPRFIERSFPKNNACGFVISHYHHDHYNLFPWFKNCDKFLSNIYVPDMPTKGPSSVVTYAIMEFLSVASIANFSRYRILPDIFRKCRRPIIPLKKGEVFQEADKLFRVFWPDFDHRLLRKPQIIRKAEIARRKLKPLVEKYGVRIADRNEGYTTEEFFGLIQELSQGEEERESERRKAQKSLWQLEETFRGLADVLSLAFTSISSEPNERCLFLGDLTNPVLNQINIPTYRSFGLVKASHHGTRFGKSLAKISTEFLVISRNQEECPRLRGIHDGYLNQMRCRLALVTELLGSCRISNGRIQIIS